MAEIYALSNNHDSESTLITIKREYRCSAIRRIFFLDSKQGDTSTCIAYLISVTMVLTSLSVPFYFCVGGPYVFLIALALSIACNYYSYICVLEATEREDEPYRIHYLFSYFPNIAEKIGIPRFKYIYYYSVLFIVVVIIN
jgi:hypothetical protein